EPLNGMVSNASHAATIQCFSASGFPAFRFLPRRPRATVSSVRLRPEGHSSRVISGADHLRSVANHVLFSHAVFGVYILASCHRGYARNRAALASPILGANRRRCNCCPPRGPGFARAAHPLPSTEGRLAKGDHEMHVFSSTRVLGPAGVYGLSVCRIR